MHEGDVRRAGLDPAERTRRRSSRWSQELLGFPRHLSQHVGGFVITRGRLDELVPIENAAMADRTVIEWDKDDLEALGMLKVDVLALGMLTCIRTRLRFHAQHYGYAPTLRRDPGRGPGRLPDARPRRFARRLPGLRSVPLTRQSIPE